MDLTDAWVVRAPTDLKDELEQVESKEAAPWMETSFDWLLYLHICRGAKSLQLWGPTCATLWTVVTGSSACGMPRQEY